MNEPVVVKNPFAVGVVALLQLVAPAMVAVSCLYFMLAVYDVTPGQYFHTMAFLAGFLSLLLPRPPRTLSAQIFVGSGAMALGVVGRWGLLLAIMLAVGYVTKFSEEFARRVVLSWAVLTPAILIVVTLGLNETMRRLLCHPGNFRRTVFAGFNEGSRALAERIGRSTELCMNVCGFFDDRGRDRLHVDGNVRILGRLNELAQYVRANAVEVIFIALPVRHVQRVADLIEQLRDTTASVYYLPDIVMYDLIQARSGSVEGIPVISMCETPFYGYRGIAKRATDIVLTSIILLLSAPLMLAIAALIKMTSPGPAVFRQRRYGLNGEEFAVFKFRTMTVVENGDTITQATADDRRVTPLGRILRRYSLDELPQLFNVLQGRMSLVGPRPHAVAHNEMYRRLIKGYMLRHKVRPGITGLAQVHGLRGETRTVEQMEARVRYDLEYLRSWSIFLDLKILAKTALRVLNDRAAY